MECRLVASIQDTQQLCSFLQALSEQSALEQQVHETVLKPTLNTHVAPGVHVLKLVHVTNTKSGEEQWHVVYQGAIMRTKAAAELPATVRPQQHSMLQAPDVTSCFHAMGFERDYEVLKRGRCFSFAYHGIGMQAGVYQVFRLQRPADVASAQPISTDCWLVEVSTQVKDGQYTKACEELGSLQQLLAPLVTLVKPTA